ncbi:MAG: ABC transporter ATP-binding protein [Gammaproteobacteria bacterium]|nr:ABC transporter ATP-binding protein [Gammaproteobacteria bacterium]
MSTPDISGAAEPASPVIEARGLTRRFGSRFAVVDLTLTVAAGEIHGLIGANGGGKTTTLRLLAGLLTPTAGHAAINGFELAHAATRIRGSVGYMPQRLALHGKLSVLENLQFRAALFNVPDSASTVQRTADEFGLDEYLAAPVAVLSGGQARLAQLAATLLHAPRVLLLDEPTAGLDALARQTVWRHLTRLVGTGVAVVIATHDLAEAERCARVTVLADGQVRAQGEPSTIVAAAQAKVYILSGHQVLQQAHTLAARADVFAAYPSAGALRIVAAGASIARELNHAGTVTETTLNFEDATLVLAAQADQSSRVRC